MASRTTRPPRSERELIRREMNRFSMGGRFGDWLSNLPFVTQAKVYKLEAEDSMRANMFGDAAHFMSEARKLWPEIDQWDGRYPVKEV